MYLILMRHGDAEPMAEGIDNFHRCLIPKGMRRVRRTARILSHFLKGRDVQIYCSPFERTRQTAQIAAEEWAVNEIHTAGELTQPLWDSVQKGVLADRSGPFLLVSHQPFLQHWLYEATGSIIEFQPGSAAVIRYVQTERKGMLSAYLSSDLRHLKKEDS